MSAPLLRRFGESPRQVMLSIGATTLTLMALLSSICTAVAQAQSDLYLKNGPDITVTPRSVTPLIDFRTTKAAWGKICGNQHSLCGEPEGLAYAGSALVLIIPAVVVSDAIVGIFTAPYDLVAAPFREHRRKSIMDIMVSGQIFGEKGPPSHGTPAWIRVSVMPPQGNSWMSGEVRRTELDENGRFTVRITLEATEEDRLYLDISTGKRLGDFHVARTCCSPFSSFHPSSPSQSTLTSVRKNWIHCGEKLPVTTIENKEHRTLSELLMIPSETPKIESRTMDWESDAAALRRIQEIIDSHPSGIATAPLWAEGTFFDYSYVVANIGRVSVESSGYHACVKDTNGNSWFLRTVPADGWKP